MAKKTKTPEIAYENNPFMIGLNGLNLFFANAKMVAFYAFALTIISLIADTASNIVDSSGGFDKLRRSGFDASLEPGQLAVAAVVIASIVFVLLVVFLLLYGVLDYASGQMALNEKVGLKQSFREVADEIASYVWLYVIIFVKIFLWSLLFIIPGIIMAVRYSLAGAVFFAEGKRGNAAVTRSLELTKGAWFTTFAGTGLWNLMTFGQANLLINPGANAILYRQLRDVTDAGQPKPAAHWLSWLTLVIPIVLFVVVIFTMVSLFAVLSMYPTAP